MENIPNYVHTRIHLYVNFNLCLFFSLILAHARTHSHTVYMQECVRLLCTRLNTHRVSLSARMLRYLGLQSSSMAYWALFHVLMTTSLINHFPQDLYIFSVTKITLFLKVFIYQINTILHLLILVE